MTVAVEFEYLEPRPGSNHRQWFVKGRKIFAETLYRATVNSEPRTPEEVARDYDLPVEVVLEAIDYSIRNKEILDAERARGLERLREFGLLDPPPEASNARVKT